MSHPLYILIFQCLIHFRPTVSPQVPSNVNVTSFVILFHIFNDSCTNCLTGTVADIRKKCSPTLSRKQKWYNEFQRDFGVGEIKAVWLLLSRKTKSKEDRKWLQRCGWSLNAHAESSRLYVLYRDNLIGVW